MGLKSFHSIIQYKHDVLYRFIWIILQRLHISIPWGTKSTHVSKLAKEIWHWCIDNEVHISAAHTPGATNVEAHQESRVFKDNTEWMLRSDIIIQNNSGKVRFPYH